MTAGCCFVKGRFDEGAVDTSKEWYGKLNLTRRILRWSE